MGRHWPDVLRWRRYGVAAPLYDVVSLEPLLYRAGRVPAIEALRLRAGDTVLVVGCGTGLDLPLLEPAVGPGGRVVAVDRSPDMLEVARRRTDRRGWSNVTLRRGDAACVERATAGLLPSDGVDGLLFTYSLGVIEDWEQAWTASLALLRPGGRVAVVDTTYPTGWGRLLAPLAALAILAGGVHPDRRVWERVATVATDIDSGTARVGHIRWAAGTVT